MTFAPKVKSRTSTDSLNVYAMLYAIGRGNYKIPDFQRDSSQWDLPKRSLFIESIINNFTVPPLIIYPENDIDTGREVRQVIDGQQRLMTIKDFIEGKFALASEDDVDYSENVGALISQKHWDELEQSIKDQINDYTLSFLVLPKDLDPMLRRTIFRRINEGGLPLSRHDLRLSDFGDSMRVYYIRIAGIFDISRPGSSRMLEAAAKFPCPLNYPWENDTAWKKWWTDTKLSQGQAPSEMFLYYLIARDLDSVDLLLKSQPTLNALRLSYDRTTPSVLDIYCAQAKSEEDSLNHPHILAPLKKIREWFADFELWFNAIKTAKVPRINVNSSTKIAFFIAASSVLWPGPDGPDQVTESQWELFQIFLTQGPGKIYETIGLEFPISKGKWPGQKKQIDKTFEICSEIKKK